MVGIPKEGNHRILKNDVRLKRIGYFHSCAKSTRSQIDQIEIAYFLFQSNTFYYEKIQSIFAKFINYGYKLICIANH